MSLSAILILLGVAIFIVPHVYQGYRQGISGDDGKMICPACGSQGLPASKTKGSLWIEIVLWLCFIVPGLIYSIWRMTSKYEVCPACNQSGMIPLKSPNGKRLAEQFTSSPRSNA